MRKIFEIILLMFVSITSYCQCDSNKIIFVDSLGNEIDSIQTNPIYVLNNGKDTLYLDQLHNMDFTRQIQKNPYGLLIIDSLSADSIINEQNDTVRICIVCSRKDIRIIDSIDINNDGVKELFLFREWYCSAKPMYLNIDPYGIGVQQQYYSKYEVWDIQKKNKIFEVNNICEIDVATSVSDSRSYGYRFEVLIDNKGNFYLSDKSNGIVGGLEMGTYKYDAETNIYKKE